MIKGVPLSLVNAVTIVVTFCWNFLVAGFTFVHFFVFTLFLTKLFLGIKCICQYLIILDRKSPIRIRAGMLRLFILTAGYVVGPAGSQIRNFFA